MQTAGIEPYPRPSDFVAVGSCSSADDRPHPQPATMTRPRFTSVRGPSACTSPEGQHVTTGDLAALSSMLEREAIEYALIGGHAVNAWLEPRFTADVDIVVAAGSDDFDRLKRVLAGEGFTVTGEHGADQPSGPDFVRLESDGSPLVLEVQAAKTLFQQEVIRRASIGAAGARIATVEDLIVMKLIADRAKDQVDLLGLVELPDIDWSYIERWAGEWQILDRLERVLGTKRKD